MAVNVTIFHDADGHILSVIKDPAPSAPSGFTALSKTLNSISDAFGKRIKIADDTLIDRDGIELTTSEGNVIGASEVKILAFKKVDGETGNDLTASSDDELLQADLRENLNDASDLGFLREESKAFVSGAVSFELAAAAVTSKETLVLYNPLLETLRLNITYG